MNIYEKLLKIQTDLKAPKSQYNAFGKYNYRNCEDIFEAVKPLCNKNKVVLTVGDSIVQVGERYYIQATATLIDLESESVINNTAYAREEAEKKGIDGSQVTGASSSYARKYALNGLFAIDDTKDSDTTNSDDPEPSQQPLASKQAKQPKPSPPKDFIAAATEIALPKNYTRADVIRVAAEAFENLKGIPALKDKIKYYATALSVTAEEMKAAVYKYVPDGILDKASDTARNSIFLDIKGCAFAGAADKELTEEKC